MSEYIKKFETAESANNYVIADIPFITSIATDPILNLVCNLEGKKLVNTSGTVSVEDGLISFTINGTTYYAEPDMLWGDWVIDSQYNTGEYIAHEDGLYTYIVEPTNYESVQYNGVSQKITDTIIGDAEYVHDI